MGAKNLAAWATFICNYEEVLAPKFKHDTIGYIHEPNFFGQVELRKNKTDTRKMER